MSNIGIRIDTRDDHIDLFLDETEQRQSDTI